MTSGSHIALFIPNFEAGGAERVMIRLAQGLVERGHQVDLLVLSDRGAYRAEVDSKVNIVNLGATRALFGIYPLIKYLRAKRPTTLLSAIFHANFIAVISVWLSGTNTWLVISEHNTLDLIKSSVNRFVWQIFKLAVRMTYPYADSVVCVSSGIANGLVVAIPRLSPNLNVIANPVITDEVLKLSLETVDHQWLAPGQPPLVLAVGRLVRAKGFDLLIEAFSQVLSKQAANLLILGEGAERTSLQAQIDGFRLSKHVCLYGFTANPYAWMSKADLFVLPSRHEGLPGALIEAMACGCKVLATDCPHGPDEILEHGTWGRLVPAGNALAIANGIIEELNSIQKVDSTRRAQAYHLSSVILQYEHLLLPKI